MTALIKPTAIDGVQYALVSQLEELGYKVIPFASLSESNIPLFDDKGELSDLLIPMEDLHFTITNYPKMEDK
jgi:hypothetical protein